MTVTAEGRWPTHQPAPVYLTRFGRPLEEAITEAQPSLFGPGGPRNLRRRALLDMTTTPTQGSIDVNAVVSYNLRAIRRRRGMTQAQVAAALARYTGHRLPQASISAMERGFDGQRRRRFDAQELYLLSMVFRVPIVYFLLPPPGEDRHLAGTGRPLQDLYAAALGREHPLTALDGRTGPGPGAWPDDDLRWREHRLDEIPDPADIDAAMRLVGAMFALATAGFPSFCRDHRKDNPDA